MAAAVGHGRLNTRRQFRYEPQQQQHLVVAMLRLLLAGDDIASLVSATAALTSHLSTRAGHRPNW